MKCLQFSSSRVSLRRRSSSVDETSSVFMRVNCNFVTLVELTNDERCLVHDLRVEKHCSRSDKIMKMFSNK